MTFGISDAFDTAACPTRVVIEIILNCLIGSLLEPGRIQSHKMADGQFLWIMTYRAEYIFIAHVFFVLAGIETVVLVGSTLMAFPTIRIHIDGTIDPALGWLTAMAAHTTARGITGIITEPTAFSSIGCQNSHIGGLAIVKMSLGVGAGAVVAGNTLSGDPVESVVKRMGS